MPGLFAKRLRSARIKKNLKQKDVAAFLGVSNGTISFYENGTYQPPVESLTRLASLYGISTDYLLGLDRDENKMHRLIGLSKKQQTLIVEVIRKIIESSNNHNGGD